MREGWKEVNFGDVVQFPPKISMKKGTTYPFIPMEAIDSGKKYVKPKEEKPLTSGGAKFEEGDTLFARITPCLQNGKISQAKNLNGKPGFGSTEYFIFRGKEGITDTDFIYYLTLNSWFKDKAIGSMVGASGRQRADTTFVRNIEIELPPLSTQRKIASILSGYDDLIENNLKRIKLLEEKAQLTYEEWFVKMRFPGYETAVFNEVTGLPEGWDKVKLGQLLEITSSKRIFLSDYVEEGIPFYRSKEIILKSKNEALNDLLYISKNKFEEIKNKFDLPKSGDILVTAVGTLGYPYLITDSDGDFYFKDGNLIWLKNSQLISSTYLISCFKNENFQSNLKNIAIGSSQKALTISSLKDILILNPKSEIQLNFDSLIIPLFNSIENLQNQNRLLKEARDILLPRLMSGMIDVDKMAVPAAVEELGI
ncbi:restriction endonuclease subunit S [Flavobacterium maritimum]|uniref:restriction endonuclease subunit S n=1 Tax=Flavobacterium maritimum TaxID=3149042 RepID=UPI0032B60E46